MSQRVEVVRLSNVFRHPNAKHLSVAWANGTQIIFRSDEFQAGDLAAIVPVDAIVPDTPIWEWLHNPLRPKDRRIRAKRLRGLWSFGIPMWPPQGAWVGQDVTKKMGIKFAGAEPKQTGFWVWLLSIWMWLNSPSEDV